jgi:hypothetical protein
MMIAGRRHSTRQVTTARARSGIVFAKRSNFTPNAARVFCSKKSYTFAATDPLNQNKGGLGPRGPSGVQGRSPWPPEASFLCPDQSAGAKDVQ